MATAVQIAERRTLDWESGPIEILSLLPAIRDGRLDIEPPPDHKFVLRIGNEYFQRFHSVRRGPATSNLAKAMQIENLVVAVSFAVFIVGDEPTLKGKMFVELIQTNVQKKKG